MKKKITFTHNKMQKIIIEQMLDSEPTFANCFTENLTKDFFADLNNRIHGDIPDHIVLFLWGETGSFKSSVAQVIAEEVQPGITGRQIVFTDVELLNAFSKSEPGEIYIRDETPKMMGIGSGRITASTQLVAETLRMRQNSLIFISPVFHDVPTAHYYLRTIDRSTDNKYVRVGVQNPQSLKYLGYIIIEIKYGSKIWQQYIEKKKKWLEQVKGQNFEVTDFEGLAKRVMSDKRFKSCKKRSEIKLLIHSLMGTMTKEEQHMIYTAIMMKSEIVKMKKKKKKN